jgi:pimeloyl-ACP methyl ester carboxylesterase
MADTGDRMVKANGVELCVETFGDPGDPAVLLISGATGSMDWWEDEFCHRLACGERYVIRYDHRDTGRSASYPAGAPGYTGTDLVTDAVGLLDTLGVARAHLVGVSMGGGIAQQAALDHPDRVASLTLIANSPISTGAGHTHAPADGGPDQSGVRRPAARAGLVRPGRRDRLPDGGRAPVRRLARVRRGTGS